MYLLFVDESGKPEEELFALGGVAVRADEWGVLRDRLVATREAHDWPADKEIKWHGTRTGEVPPALADNVYATLASCPLTCFTVIIKTSEARERSPELFGTPAKVYEQALMWLIERYQLFLVEKDAYGVIVLDSRREGMDDRLRGFFEGLQLRGTPYVQLERIVDALLLGPSHYSIGLQVADLVAGSSRFFAQGHLGDGSRWHKQLRKKFAHHPHTLELDGVGLVIYPRESAAQDPAPAKLFPIESAGAGT